MLIRLSLLFFLIIPSAWTLELNDGHIHYNQDIWDKLKAEDALRLLNENKIHRAIVSSTPTTGTEKLLQLAPDKIIPFLRPYRNFRDRFTWHSDPSIIDHIKQHLDKGIYRGIGEFHLFKEHKNTDIIQTIMRLAASHRLTVKAHSDTETIEALLNMQPEVTIIWAHCGMDHPVSDIRRMLKQYSKLFCELSFREGITDEEEILTSEWKQLLTLFPDRFITGSDTYIPSRWANLPDITNHTRHWLRQLPQEILRQVSKDNLNRLLPENL